MPRSKDARENQSTIRVGNIDQNRGTIQIAGRDIKSSHISNGFSAAEVNRLFNQVYRSINAHDKTSSITRKDLKAEVKEIQVTVTEAAKNHQKVDANFLSRRFRNIARMAPDILDVVVATLAGPFSGLGILAEKVAKKAKEDVKAS